MAEQAALSFGGLLRQLRGEANLTQEELAEAAQLSPRSVSDLERGINRTARKDTAELLADALDLAEPVRALFVAAARGRSPAKDVLAAREGRMPGAAGGAAQQARGCPYRGLLPFGESDAEVFYGRERLAAELAAKLAARVTGGGLVVVTGASGSGKSSLLRAGLLPILARGQLVSGSDRWPRIVMTPTKDPLSELAARLAAVGGPDALAVRDGLTQHPDQAHLAVWSAVLAASARRDEQSPASGDGAARLVLIVDQFEQVFTLNPNHGEEAGRQTFITALCAAAMSPVGSGQVPPALVVIAVRGDFWDQCAAVPELVGALQDGQFVVGPMTDSELRVAITGPAQAAGLQIDPALTETILGDLRVAAGNRSAGVLPLLSQAMALTWEHREEDRLTSHGYAQAGGVSHAVQTGADRVYGALPAGQQALAREVLRSMTVASRDGGYARRPVTREDLYAGLPGADRGDIDAVLDAFAAQRLAVLDEDTAQLSHDVLLRAWPRLRTWLEEDQASWIVHGQLADATAAWHDSHDDPSFLYRGTQLAALQQAVTRWSANPAHSPALTGTQRDFLQASERAATRSTHRRRAGLALLALLAVLALAASAFAFSQQAAAIRQRDQAIYNKVIAEALQSSISDAALAAQLTLAAYRIQPTPDLASRLLNTQDTPMSFPPFTVGTSGFYSMAFKPGGHVLASGGADGVVRLWNATDPARPRLLGHGLTSGGGVGAVTFSPGGHMLASGDDKGTIRLWDVTDPAHPRPLGLMLAARVGAGFYSAATVNSVAFSPDAHTLAAGTAGGTVRLWDVADPAHPRPLSEPLTGSGGVSVDSVAFSAKDHVLASGDNDGTIRLWDIADPAHPRPLGQPLTGSGGVPVLSVAFSPGGHTLASGDADGAVRLWDDTDPTHPRPLGPTPAAGTASVYSVAFGPGGDTLASGSVDGTIRLWDVADPAHSHLLSEPLTSGGGVSVDSVAFSPDGHTLASGCGDGTIRLWALPQTVLTGSTSVIASQSDPYGHTLASGDVDGTIRLWDVADPAHPRPLGQPLTGSGSGVGAMAFSPDGHTLASGDVDGTIRLWDVADPTHPRPLGHPLTTGSGGVYSVAFTPGGHTLASGDFDGTVRLWDVADPARPRPLGPTLTTGTAAIYSVAFSPGGHTLASGDSDGAVRLWDVADPAHPRPLGQPLTGSGGVPVGSVTFSPGGHTLASADGDGTIRLWNLNIHFAIQRICSTAGGLTPRQWSEYITQLPYQQSCAY